MSNAEREFAPSIFEEMADRTENAAEIEAREEEKRREARRLADELVRRKRVARDVKILTPVADAIRGLLLDGKDLEVLLNLDDANLTVAGIDCRWFVSVEEIHENAGFRSATRGTGRYKIVVGDYGGRRGRDIPRRSFPPKKDGTYSYTKIAEAILEHVEDRLKAGRLVAVKTRNEAAAEEARRALGIDRWDYFQVSASANEKGPVRYEFKITGVGDVQEIVRLGEALRALELKLSYKG